MRKALVVLGLMVALLAPAAAFAGDDRGSDQDHNTAVPEAIQTEPIQLGVLSGAERAPFGPYFELRQENYGN